MSLRFYNTLSREIDEFVPLAAERVTIYTCGPTVYDRPHVGNWAAYIYWDILVRILMAHDYTLNRALNITDVGHLTSDADTGEDKLAKGAKREHKTAWEIADYYAADFLDGMKKLNMIEPQHIARATKYINQQLALIRKLKEKGFTYQIDDGIYFDTSKFPTYADFAHLDLADQKAGARVKFNSEKRNPSDFALWKFSPTDEKRDMEWETPADLLDNRERVTRTGAAPAEQSEEGAERAAGPVNSSISKPIMGFPGWHIECSAIALNLLGNTIDIHTGGIDHIPVHHTNEIAQSEAATGVKFANYWLHCNHMKINDTKVSKSLGNGYTLQDIASKGFSPLDLRMFVLQSHYRSEGNFTIQALESAHNRLQNWRNIAALRHQTHDTLTSDSDKSTDFKTISLYATSQAIKEAIDNDLGTPMALKIIDDAFFRISTAPKLEDIDGRSLSSLLETIDKLLGLDLINSTPDISDDAKKLILVREQARTSRDFKKSDEIRDQLKADFHISLRDTDFDTIWEYNDEK